MTPGKDYLALACGVMIFNADGKLLMMLRSINTRADHGRWGIPGGLVEFNETVEDAIRRETKEETDAELRELQYLGYVEHILRDEGKHFVSQIFLAKSFSGEAVNMEPDKFERFEWFDIDDLPENTSEVVHRAVEHYKRWTREQK